MEACSIDLHNIEDDAIPGEIFDIPVTLSAAFPLTWKA